MNLNVCADSTPCWTVTMQTPPLSLRSGSVSWPLVGAVDIGGQSYAVIHTSLSKIDLQEELVLEWDLGSLSKTQIL